jgi:hypothetical protein
MYNVTQHVDRAAPAVAAAAAVQQCILSHRTHFAQVEWVKSKLASLTAAARPQLAGVVVSLPDSDASNNLCQAKLVLCCKLWDSVVPV